MMRAALIGFGLGAGLAMAGLSVYFLVRWFIQRVIIDVFNWLYRMAGW